MFVSLHETVYLVCAGLVALRPQNLPSMVPGMNECMPFSRGELRD